MEQEQNTFEYIKPIQEPQEENINITTKEQENEKQLAEDFVTGLPSWDLEPPYEVVRRVNR